MTIVVLLVIVAVVGAVAIVLLGRAGVQTEFAPDRPLFVLPEHPISAADIDAVRFAVGVRGYRMDQVDVLVDRLAAELADRDRQLAELRGEAAPADTAATAEPAEPRPDGEPFVEDPLAASLAAAANAAAADAASRELPPDRPPAEAGPIAGSSPDEPAR